MFVSPDRRREGRLMERKKAIFIKIPERDRRSPEDKVHVCLIMYLSI